MGRRIVTSRDFSGRDQQGRSEVETILSELPSDHPARIAFGLDVSTETLREMLRERLDLAERLDRAILAQQARLRRKAR